jgi:hypothetical protein|tara:strand:+ start:455 stop:1087 length:633 start_codon:yes stop_codon:yes gene_type:complete
MVDAFTADLPGVDDLLSGGGSPSLSFKDAEVGQTYEGTIADLRAVQVRNYEDPTKLEFWDDGKPKMQIEVTLQTGYADPSDSDDDGKRRVFLFGQKLRAAKEELAKKGFKTFEVGMKFKIILSGTKPSQNKRYNDVKLYSIELGAATTSPAVDEVMASVGAKKIASDKIVTLSAKQLKVAETLLANGFTAEEIAEQIGEDVAVVNSSLTF